MNPFRVMGLWLALAALPAVAAANAVPNGSSYVDVARQVQPKVVKLYGAGGLRGLEAYQSGLLISGDGYVLTVWSYVLDADDVTVVLDDGRRFLAKHVAADPLAEIALLKFEPDGDELPHFDLARSATAEAGSRVLAFSNLFGIATGDEPVSVLHGMVTAVAPLDARRGSAVSHYRSDVYVVDAAVNNPGAAGGALTDSKGELLGLLGKELRSNLTGTWLNYALPVSSIAPTVEEMRAGRYTPPELGELDQPESPHSLSALGIVLVPDVVTRTPPYIDRIVPESVADRSGLLSDDLLIMIEGNMVTSIREAHRLIGRLESDASVELAVLRGGSIQQISLPAGTSTPRGASTESDAATIVPGDGANEAADTPSRRASQEP